MKKRALVLFICFIILIFTSKRGVCGDINTSSKKGLNYVEGQVIIKIKPKIKSQISITSVKGDILCGISSISNLNKEFKVTSMKKVFTDTTEVKISSVEKERLPDLSTIYLLEFPEEIDIWQVVKTYKKDANIEYAEPNYIYKMFETPNDTYYSQQWHLPKIRAAEGWDLEKGKDTVLIAVVDSGVDTDHPDLIDKIVIKVGCNKVEGENPNDPNPTPDGQDDNGRNGIDEGVTHGTHVAGIAAAITNNSKGVAGVAWNCKILPVKVLNDEGEGTSTNISAGIQFAADHVGNAGSYASGVINLSLGGPYGDTYTNAIDYAYKRRCVIVAAAGNGGDDGVGDELRVDGSGDNKVSPVCNDGSENMVLGVAAVNSSDNKTTFSNYSQSSTGYVEVCAPGVSIYSTLFYDGIAFNNYYGYMQGTSMATPIVSGLAALVISSFNTLTVQDVKKCIIDNGVDLSSQNIGKRVDVYLALNPPPDIKITVLKDKEEKMVNSGTFDITWTDSDANDNAKISLFLDKDTDHTNNTFANEGRDWGKINTALIWEDDDNDTYSFKPVDVTTWTVANTNYYIYAEITDERTLVRYYTKYTLNIFEEVPITGEKVVDSSGATEVNIESGTFTKVVAVKVKVKVNKNPTSTTPTSIIKQANEQLKGCKNIKTNDNLENTISEILILDPNDNFNKVTLAENKRIGVTIYYTPNGVNENDLRIFYLDTTDKKWKLVKDYGLDTANNKITGTISSSSLEGLNTSMAFSNSMVIPTIYKIMGLSSIADLNDMISWPNPFSPTADNYCYVDNLPNDSEIKIRIFNLAGEEIVTFGYSEGEVVNGGTRLRIKWNGKNSSGELVAPGLYFYVVKTKNDTKVEKMVVVR